MQTIYVIQNEIGDYSDRREENLCAVTTEEKAKAFVALFVELNEFNCAFNDRLRNEFHREWDNKNPRPQMLEKPKPSPRFRELQFLLTEDARSHDVEKFIGWKKEYKELQNQHLEKIHSFNETLQEWNKQVNTIFEKRKAAEFEWYNKNYILPSHLHEVAKIVDDYDHHLPNLDNKYSYYELKLFH